MDGTEETTTNSSEQLPYPDVVQAGTADGSAAKKGKAGSDVEIDMREEAQKGRVRQYLRNF